MARDSSCASLLATALLFSAFTASAFSPPSIPVRPHLPRAAGATPASSDVVDDPAAAAKAITAPQRSSPATAAADLRALLLEPPVAAVQDLVARVEAASSGSEVDLGALQGDWRLAFQLSSKQATKSQKAFETSGLPQYSNFIRNSEGREIFRNIVAVTQRRVRVVADVAWEPPPSSSSPAPASRDALPCRLGSTICRAGVEVGVGRRFGWEPLRIPLPLRGEGWLEVTHLSEDMRITRGNRGGLFVHLRPHLYGAVAGAAAGAAAATAGTPSQDESKAEERPGSNVESHSVPQVFQDMADALVKEVTQEVAADAEWKETSKASGITTWKKDGEGSTINVRGRTTMKAPAATVLALYLDGDRAKELDSSFKAARDVETFDAHNKIGYEAYNGMAVVSGRDFCSFSTQRCLEDGTLVFAARSVEHEQCPTEQKLVRAEIAVAGLVVKPAGDASCTVDYLSRADLKGKIPGWIKDKFAEEDPLILGTMRKIVEAEYAEIASKIKPGDTPVYAA